MSVPLSNVFSALGFTKKNQQISLVKFAALRGCFGEKTHGKFISDEEAGELLKTSFPTMQEGIVWLRDITNKNWLRASFRQEGVGNGKDPVVNMERWLTSNNESFTSQEEAQLLDWGKTLGLVGEVPCPQTKEKITHVVIHGGLQEHVSERIAAIPFFSGNLYYLSNPRGLFNNEPALAPILADWFNRPEAEATIQNVLNKHKDIKTSDKHWLKDLAGLKAEILLALGEKNWPLNRGWYYQNPKPFDDAAQAEKRQSLAGWPTATDMVSFLFNQRVIKHPGDFNAITHPIYSVRAGRIANTEDSIEDWYKLEGQYFTPATKVLFISNNSRGLHYIPFQQAVLITTLKRMGSKLNITTIGSGDNSFNLAGATDVLAKIIYTKSAICLQSLQTKTVSCPSMLFPSGQFTSQWKKQGDFTCDVREYNEFYIFPEIRELAAIKHVSYTDEANGNCLSVSGSYNSPKLELQFFSTDQQLITKLIGACKNEDYLSLRVKQLKNGILLSVNCTEIIPLDKFCNVLDKLAGFGPQEKADLYETIGVAREAEEQDTFMMKMK